MSHRAPFVAFQHKARDRKFAYVIRSVLISDIEAFRDVFHRQLWFTLKKIQDLKPPVIGESFDDSLKFSVCAASNHRLILPYTSLLQNTSIG